MKIGVLTSSRADYGIYLPLLRKLKADAFFQLEIIAFGTHLSKTHGYTLSTIENDGFEKIHHIDALRNDDSQKGISISYANTILKFADFWQNNRFNLVCCLGDRFEMSAAVQSSIPFGVKLAHIHGGETTLGAIDNIYRHQITLASKYHFVATQKFKEKVKQLTNTSSFIYNVGSLSLYDINSFKPKDKTKFLKDYKISFQDYILATFHSETVSSTNNMMYAEVMKNALMEISSIILVVVTMPNADTLGSIYRNKLIELRQKRPNEIILIENFGKENYFNAMYYSKLLIGNTSSGIIEAASFRKYVVNVGNRQAGRMQSKNIMDVAFDETEMVNQTMSLLKQGPYKGKNLYFKENSVEKIMEVLQNKLK